MAGTCYIFLDYDGVVACARKWWKIPAHKGFEPKAIANLNGLVQQIQEAGMEASVVPITSRLRWQPVSVIKRSLCDAGFTGTIEDGLEIGSDNYMPKQVWVTRGEALKNWCTTHLQAGDTFIILDNNPPKNLPDSMKPRWIHVNGDDKLTAKDTKKALALLDIKPTAARTEAAPEESLPEKTKKKWRQREEDGPDKAKGNSSVSR